ncbi:MAG: lysophospholipid acyltransferase family protein [Sediminibacterium sp. Gen4]|jgi:Kdo2-lipid IVA lauroyltransferase/acyltransferase|nr:MULTISPECIES: lysophospholipid acyltransferase family protein [unclassified Sediminibacterium]MBW0163225.1 lysophospholipid acyltransferase family protein [Sediminibacterium sp.]NWK65291.1 lysophospholipid acyltransferase family protein [Sediminibacterium sp. Gen4]
MYTLVSGLFYLLSRLPWWLLYLIGDGIYVLLYYVFGYRKKVVAANLLIAFPEKTAAERKQIEKKFYHNFVDTFIETIKLFSVSEKELRKRFICNIEVLNDLYAGDQNVQIVSGHYFNWEYANLGVAMDSKFPFVAVYMPLSNKVFDQLIYKFRTRFGTLLVPASEFKQNFHQYARNRYALALVADQNPGNPGKAYWTNFFSKPAPFARGPEKGAKMNNTAVVYAHFYKVKRGYYQLEFELITTKPHDFADGELTKLLVKKVEDSVRKIPDNYLWSHRRWKYSDQAEKYKHLMV